VRFPICKLGCFFRTFVAKKCKEMKNRSLSVREKGMIAAVVLLGLLVALRWGYIRQRAADGMNFLKPVADTVQSNSGQ